MVAQTKETATFTADEQDEIRSAVRSIMEAENLSQAAVARDSGIAYGTFTGWLAGTYQGNNDRVAGEVQIWLTSRQEKKRAATAVPRVPGFQITASAQAFVETLTFAQVIPEISVIAGGAGIGKTSAAEHYAATNSNVWLATMDPTTSGVHPMLAEICEVMGIVEKSASKLTRAIGRKVQGAGGLIVVDEAQHLSTAALDQLRSLHDRYKVGIALIGNETVYSRLEGEGRKAGFAQLYSRVGVRVTQLKPRAEDMCALIKAWNVTDPEEVKFLKAVARKPGALRGMTKCLQLASMLAAGSGKDRNIRHLKAAWDRLSASTVAE